MSQLNISTLANLAGSESTPIADVINGSARAWVNFNGTGTVAIRASYNVSSITDNGTGDYTVNFTNAMPDADYSVVAMSSGFSQPGPTTTSVKYGTTLGVSSVSVVTGRTGGAGSSPNFLDPDILSVAIFR